MTLDYLQEVEIVSRIPALPTILGVMARTTGTRLVILAKVTEERWVACSVQDQLGLGFVRGMELDVRSTICYEVFRRGNPIVVNDVLKSDAYRDHISSKSFGFRSFMTVPVVLADGSFFGTLSGIDPDPLMIDRPEIAESVRLLSELAAFHIQAELDLDRSRTMLANEQQVSKLREQFIAGLGHGLRDPLESLANGARMLAVRPDQSVEIAGEMASSVGRMNGLIDDVTDFARGRLGGGLTLDMGSDLPLGAILRQVIHDLNRARPDKLIEVDMKIEEVISCDHSRIAQLVSNLVANALLHGSDDVPVTIRAQIDHGTFEFAVTNGGPPIAAEAMETLFEPFSRTGTGRPGLGLGLYIASEIAKAHNGSIVAVSNQEYTTFTFRMPAVVVKDEGAVIVYHQER